MRGAAFEALRSSSQRKLLLKRVLLAFLILLTAISTLQGAGNAIPQSQDLQWSASKLLVDHLDPWAEYLRGDPNDLFLQSQYPNFLPILYILIFPLGLLPLLSAKILWLVCNIVFAIISAILAARFYRLRHSQWEVAIICLISSASSL